MSPIRQLLLDTIEQASDGELADMLSLLQAQRNPIFSEPIDPSTQAWNATIDRLNHLTPEQRAHQRQSIAELFQTWDNTADEEEESWEELKIALDQNRNSYRPLFP